MAASAGARLSLREQGNDAFRNGNWETAAKFYTRSIEEEEKHVSGTNRGPGADLELLLAYSNRSEAWLRMHDFDRTLQDAEKALSYDPTHSKSLLRKAKALRSLGQFSQAASCVRTLLLQDLGGTPMNKRDLELMLRDLERKQNFNEGPEEKALVEGKLKEWQMDESTKTALNVGPGGSIQLGKGVGLRGTTPTLLSNFSEDLDDRKLNKPRRAADVRRSRWWEMSNCMEIEIDGGEIVEFRVVKALKLMNDLSGGSYEAVTTDDKPVVVKHGPSPEDKLIGREDTTWASWHAVEKEKIVRQQLEGVSGIARLIGAGRIVKPSIWAGATALIIEKLGSPLEGPSHVRNSLAMGNNSRQVPVLPVEEVLTLAECLIETVAQMNARQVYHCDISPRNIAVCPDRKGRDRYYLFDFAAAACPPLDEYATRSLYENMKLEKSLAEYSVCKDVECSSWQALAEEKLVPSSDLQSVFFTCLLLLGRLPWGKLTLKARELMVLRLKYLNHPELLIMDGSGPLPPLLMELMRISWNFRPDLRLSDVLPTLRSRFSR